MNYWKAKIIKTVWYWCTDRQTDQRNRKEHSDLNLGIYRKKKTQRHNIKIDCKKRELHKDSVNDWAYHTAKQTKSLNHTKLKNKFQVYYRPKCERQILKYIEENIDFM